MPHQGTTTADLAEAFRSLSDRLYATDDVGGALDAVVHLATDTIDHCDWAGISRTGGAGDVVTTVAASDPVVRTADELQNELHEGPGLETLAPHVVARADDLTSSTKWPRFGTAASTRTPIRSVLSLSVHPAPQPASLTLYSATAHAFDSESIDRATLFVAHAEVLLLLAWQTDTVAQLTEALTTSRLIGNAVGMLMYAERLTSDEAFHRLTHADPDCTLFAVADELATTGAVHRRPAGQADSPAPHGWPRTGPR